MRAVDARQIPIKDLLEAEGIRPKKTRQNGRELWYSSPLRAGDSDPSFKVDLEKNLWFDFGMDKGGNVIDLVCELRHVTVKEALAILDASGLIVSTKGATSNLFRGAAGKSGRDAPAGEKEKRHAESAGNQNGHFQLLKVQEIRHPALLDYLKERAIDLEIARTYLKQVHFKPADRLNQYFALGWACGDGYDVRNRHFKGFVGMTKDLSKVNLKPGEPVYIFEGWMDFLSYLSLHGKSELKNGTIILHSTALRKRAVETIKAHDIKRITLFLDNDEVGQDTAEFFKLALPDVKIYDRSYLYKPAKDLNERLIERGKR